MWSNFITSQQFISGIFSLVYNEFSNNCSVIWFITITYKYLCTLLWWVVMVDTCQYSYIHITWVCVCYKYMIFFFAICLYYWYFDRYMGINWICQTKWLGCLIKNSLGQFHKNLINQISWDFHLHKTQKNQIMRKTSAWVYWQICSAGIVLYCRDILAD